MILLITVLALNLLIYLVIISKMTKSQIVNSIFFLKKGSVVELLQDFVSEIWHVLRHFQHIDNF